MARAALAALAEQQKIIDRQQRQIATLVNDSRHKQTAIAQLTRGLEAVARLTKTEAQVRTAIFVRQADEQNPAQPVPSPAGEAPTQTTSEAEAPEAKADVRTPGLVPNTNNDTAADAVTTAYTPGQDIGAPALNQLVDVTRPVDGTQGPRPLEETKTQVDVRVGDPMKAQVAFPVNGPFSNAQRTSAVTGERAVASLRLAKLRIASRTAASTDEVVEMDSIVRDASLTDDMIDREIATLTQVTAGQSRSDENAPRNLVPRSAAAVRTVPRLTSRTAADQDDDRDLGLVF